MDRIIVSCKFLHELRVKALQWVGTGAFSGISDILDNALGKTIDSGKDEEFSFQNILEFSESKIAWRGVSKKMSSVTIAEDFYYRTAWFVDHFNISRNYFLNAIMFEYLHTLESRLKQLKTCIVGDGSGSKKRNGIYDFKCLEKVDSFFDEANKEFFCDFEDRIFQVMGRNLIALDDDELAHFAVMGVV